MTNSKIVLITGASSGFGLITAAHLAKNGHKVIATVRDSSKEHGLINELNKTNSTADILTLDVTNIESIEIGFQEIAKKHGYIDVLVNNAGYGIGGCFEDLTQEEIREQMDTNFFGVQNMIRAALPMMRARKQGKIINISSVSGFSTLPAFGAYNASKWALEGFSESLSYELEQFGIDVYLIEPGTYRTKIFEENARYAQNFSYEKSPYFKLSNHLKTKVDERVKDCFKDPNDIAIRIEKMINRKYSKFRQIPDVESRALYILRKFLPFSVYRTIIKTAVLGGFKQ